MQHPSLRWALVTAIAPVAWGSTYYVTQAFLPAEIPLWGATIRCLPAGLVLLLLVRRLPRGAWWWRSAVLGFINVASFFVLIYIVAQLLPSGIASTIMALGPAVIMLVAWPLVGERPLLLPAIGAVLGFIGVAAMLFTGETGFNLWGILASVTAMMLTSVGSIVVKRWQTDIDPIRATAWQLTAGGLMILPFAAIIEGPMPSFEPSEWSAFAYLSLIATALAYSAWFTGLKHLSAGTVGLIGLLNPVTGVLLGVMLAGEMFGPWQLLGMLVVFVGILLGQPLVQRRLRPPTS